ncbi:membrane-anchored junction protein [Scyliorhinus canicula]|uniref:membrane-anchored junction protein n=1 Tax=Scyliorhinus canicula TaxID=7830 RepID=UPI0018F52CC7|nr:membrane-anchored junction protein [Scyliorhinus canicula]
MGIFQQSGPIKGQSAGCPVHPAVPPAAFPMPLKSFTYPLPETRFVHAGRTVYKLKMRYSHHIREDLGIDRERVRQELEDAIRAVLGNLDRLQPFTTLHFTIFPYKNEWERLSELRFKQGDKVLISYPYVCTMFIELRTDHQHSYTAEEEQSPFTDRHFVDKLAEGVAPAPVAEGTNEKEPERSQLQPNRKRSKNAPTKAGNQENMANGGTVRQKKRMKRTEKSRQAGSPLAKQPRSLGSGEALADWRIANVVPLLKKGGKDKPGDDRPVSLTRVVGKLLQANLRHRMNLHL